MKGPGESGLAGGLAAVTNAVADALGTTGIETLHVPSTPARILRRFQEQSR
jgi:carbon-monoxide dehydrogenase large subunit